MHREVPGVTNLPDRFRSVIFSTLNTIKVIPPFASAKVCASNSLSQMGQYKLLIDTFFPQQILVDG